MLGERRMADVVPQPLEVPLVRPVDLEVRFTALIEEPLRCLGEHENALPRVEPGDERHTAGLPLNRRMAVSDERAVGDEVDVPGSNTAGDDPDTGLLLGGESEDGSSGPQRS